MNDEDANEYLTAFYCVDVVFWPFCVAVGPDAWRTYSHIVGVDVIGTHNIRISILQGDPGVIDLWVKTSGQREDVVGKEENMFG